MPILKTVSIVIVRMRFPIARMNNKPTSVQKAKVFLPLVAGFVFSTGMYPVRKLLLLLCLGTDLFNNVLSRIDTECVSSEKTSEVCGESNIFVDVWLYLCLFYIRITKRVESKMFQRHISARPSNIWNGRSCASASTPTPRHA